MPEFKLRKLKGELFEILGLESYLEKKLASLKGKLLPHTSTPKPVEFKPAAKVVSKPMAAKTVKKTAAAKVEKTDDGLGALMAALENHPRKDELVRAGSQKDQLLRSLVPMYLGRSANMDVNSGLISRFWKAHGVSYAASNAAKALRQHDGYAKESKTGKQISPSGVKYVESALFKKN